MDDRIDTLAAMLAKTELVLASLSESQHQLPTPCSEFAVVDLLEHIGVWVQVFDGAVNEVPTGFDPATHEIGTGHADVFARASQAIIGGLRERGSDREMKMTASPLAGEFVLDMLLMEYIGHGWDLARATGQAVPYTEDEATTALAAAQAIIAPQYRGTGMFEDEVEASDGASPLDAFIAFTGRDPRWTPPALARGR